MILQFKLYIEWNNTCWYGIKYLIWQRIKFIYSSIVSWTSSSILYKGTMLFFQWNKQLKNDMIPRSNKPLESPYWTLSKCNTASSGIFFSNQSARPTEAIIPITVIRNKEVTRAIWYPRNLVVCWNVKSTGNIAAKLYSWNQTNSYT